MRGKPLDLSNGFKDCPKCGQTKPLTEFHRSKSTVHGYGVYCKACCYNRHNEWRKKNLKKMAEDQKRRRRADPERWFEYDLKRNYKMLRGQYATMLAAQKNKCAICKTDDPKGKGRFHVDHCHETKSIRGLLCHNCNVGLGQFKHRIDLLHAASAYLSAERSIEG